MKRRFVAVLLSLCMVISLCPVNAFADILTDPFVYVDDDHEHETSEEGSYTSPAAITLNLRGGTVVDSGTCGENATWTFYSDGTLTISGSGAMASYASSENSGIIAPWRAYSDLLTAVVIEDGITSIGNNDFYRCAAIETISIPDSVQGIGIYAFYECESLSVINIPYGVSLLNQYTFYGCSSLQNINLPSSIRSIAPHAFGSCSNLQSIVIPYGVTAINDSSFAGCSSLTSVILPESLTSIDYYAFGSCVSLVSIDIPNGVKTIGNYAFYFCKELSSVSLPNTIQSIGSYAFQSCNKLEAVRYNGTSVQWGSVSNAANSGITNGIVHCLNTSGTCGNNAKWALYDDGTLIISGSGDMYDYTYDSTSAYKAYNDQITSIIVESDITRIGDYAFYNTSATSFTIHNASLSMGTWSVGNNLNLTDIDFGSGIISPASSVFEDCKALKTVHIPSNVIMNGNSSGEGSGNDMFHTCSSLETAIVDCAYVGPYMFETDHKLKTVTFTNPDVKIYYVQDDFSTGNPFNSIRGENGSPALIDVVGYTCSDVSAMVKVLNQRYNPTSYPYSNYTFVPITNDPGHRGVVEDAAVPATCEETGLTAGSHCTICGQVIVAQEKTAALGHDYSEPTYAWSEDNASVTATAVCTHDEAHVLTETVNTTSEVTKDATTSEWGETTYTATFENELFAVQTKTVANIEPIGPTFAQYVVVYTNREMIFQATNEAVAGKIIKAVYSLSYTGSTPSWNDEKSFVTKVTFADYVAPTTTVNWFYGFTKLRTIEGLNKLDTSNTTDMSFMFSECNSLTALDLSNFDTSNVISMYAMFTGCNSLEMLDLSSFNTCKVETMHMMFFNCDSLETLNLNCFDTSNVMSMYGMFGDCFSLKTLDLSSFNTCKVETMQTMFFNCESLTTLNISTFDTGCVTDMEGMFSGCNSLTALDLTSFNTSNVENMSGMFSGCNSLTALDLTSFNTSNVENMNGMFSGCNLLMALDFTSFNTSNTTDMSYMFSDCNSLTALNLNCFDMSNVESMSGMFSGCNSLTAVTLTSFNTSNTTDMSYMFGDCNSLTTLDLIRFDTSNVKSMNSMFKGCNSLTTLDLSNFDTSKVTNMTSMFSGCSSLRMLDLSNFDTNKVESMYLMFNDCSLLTTIYAGVGFTAPNDSYMFNNCTNLVGGAGTTYDPTHVEGEYARIDKDGAPGYFTSKQHIHSLTETVRVEPTCTAAGNTAYWTCSDCSKYFADAEGQTEIEANSWVISALGHAPCEPVIENEVPATFLAKGSHDEVVCCTRCGEELSRISLETPVLTSVSGVCGPDLTWTLDNQHVLRISGTGEMYDYSTTIVSGSELRSSSPFFNYAYWINTTIVEDGVTTIGNSAFGGLSGLTSMTLPNTLTSIKNNAFSATGIAELDIPDSVSSIGSSAFYRCSRLQSIELAEGITRIEASLFDNCSSLNSLTLPESLTSIGYEPFNNCFNLRSLDFNGSYSDWSAITWVDSSYLQEKSYVSYINFAKGDITVVPTTYNWTLAKDGSLTITEFQANNYNDYASDISSVVIEDSVSAIPAYSFNGYDGIGSVTIPNTVTSIGQDAFNDCTGIKDVYYGGSCGDWQLIQLAEGNEVLLSATLHPALGHNWTISYEWSESNDQVTATAVCCNDLNHTVTETVNTTSEITLAPTTTTRGETTYTATFANELFVAQTKTVDDIDPVQPVKIGDANGDGKVTSQDRVWLSRYLAGWRDAAEHIKDLNAMDINRDGKVNAKDRVILSRYLANWGAAYNHYFE